MKKRRQRATRAALAALLLTTGSAAAADAPWPGSASGTEIDRLLPKKYEVSGMVWDPVSRQYYLVSEGIVTRLSPDGKTATHWSFPQGQPPFSDSRPDFEGVTVTGESSLVYVGRESPPAIFEFDPAAGAFTKRSWSLQGMETTDSSGMEGLTFVPNGYHPYPPGEGGGLFYASSQKNGTIYVFDAFKAGAGGPVQPIAFFTPNSKEHDVADLSFSTGTRTLYVLYGNAKRILEVQGDTLENGIAYQAPSLGKDDKVNKGFEGIAPVGTCPTGGTVTLALGNDETGAVFSYTGFPQRCAVRLDDSGDATVSEQDGDANFGAEPSLKTEIAEVEDENGKKTKKNLDILLQFTGEVPKVSKATLHLYVTDGTKNSPRLCGLAAAWSESAVTWKTTPACTGTATGGGADVANKTWVTYDVTALVQAGTRSFRLSALTTDDMIAVSKETADHLPDRRPVLIVTTVP